MVLPTIANNAPSAGSISWTDFGLQYDGKRYDIPAGSTSRKFAWWRRGDGGGENVVPDPNVEQNWGGLPSGWSIGVGSGRGGGNALRGTAAAASPVNILRVSAEDGTARTLPVNPGEIWRLSFWYRTSSDAAGTIDNWKPRLADQNNALLAGPGLSRTTAWREMSFDYRVPSDGSVTGLRLTIVLNSMTAGAILFDDFNIRRVDAAAASVESADLLPPLTAEDCLLFINRNGIGALAPATEVIEGSLIASGSILADGIGANQIDATHLRANAVTADAISANAVLAEAIAAGAVTTEKLSIASLSGDWVANGSFEDGVQGWGIMSGSGNGDADVVSGVSSAGSYALRLARGAGGTNLGVRQTPDYFIPVTALGGRRWYLSCRAGASSSVSNVLVFRVFWWRADKTSQVGYSDIASNVTLTSSWQMFEGQLVPPANASYMSVALYNTTASSTIFIDEVTAQEVIVSAQIGDGQVRAEHIVANAITATHIAAKTITANSGIIDNLAISNAQIANLDGAKITADSIEGNRLKAKTVHGDAIIAGTVLTEKLAVGNYVNLVDDPNLDLEFGQAWRRAEGSGTFTIISTTGAPGRAIRVTKAAGARTRTDNSLGFTVTPGQEYEVSGRAQNSTDGRLAFGLRFGGEADDYLSLSPVVIDGARGAWVDFTATFTVPSGAARARVSLVLPDAASEGQAWFSKISVIRRFGAEVLIDGAVTARTIQANAVTANAIAANSILAEHVRANAITTAKIATNAVTTNELAAGSVKAGILDANAVTASAIAANAITTVKIAANAVTAVELAANAVRAENIAADAITAKHTITGATIRTAATGARTEMTASGVRQISPNGDILVQLGHGVATGLAVRDPSSGAMVALAPHVLGVAHQTETDALEVVWPTEANLWQGAYLSAIPALTLRSETGRLALHYRLQGADNSQQNYSLRGAIRLVNVANNEVLSWGSNYCYAQGEFCYPGFDVISVTPGVTYRLMWEINTKKYFGSEAPARVTRRQVMGYPV